MSDRFFLDTNIFAYSFDPVAADKMRISENLIQEGIHTRRGVVSYQVVQEFFNVVYKKFPVPLTLGEGHAYFISVFRPMLTVTFSAALLLRALEFRERHSIPWYDSLILAGAVEAECDILYTEDFQHGMRAEGVRIQNPFLSN